MYILLIVPFDLLVTSMLTYYFSSLSHALRMIVARHWMKCSDSPGRPQTLSSALWPRNHPSNQEFSFSPSPHYPRHKCIQVTLSVEAAMLKHVISDNLLTPAGTVFTCNLAFFGFVQIVVTGCLGFVKFWCLFAKRHQAMLCHHKDQLYSMWGLCQGMQGQWKSAK